MKKWNAPAIAELNIEETAGGFIDIDWESPLNILFGFGKDSGDDDSSTPETEDVVNPLS